MNIDTASSERMMYKVSQCPQQSNSQCANMCLLLCGACYHPLDARHINLF